MKVVAIIQARMGSTRLPGKVMKKILGKSVILWDLERLSFSEKINYIIVAVPHDADNEIIVDAVEKYDGDIIITRGSENDVLDRYYKAAIEVNADVIVRITSDCPLIDPQVVDKVIGEFLVSNCDYCSNTLKRTYPRGLDVEVFSLQALEKAWLAAKKEYEREHVTPYIKEHPHIFSLVNVSHDLDLSHMRLTLDTIEDFRLINKIYTSLQVKDNVFLLEDILKLIHQYPELLDINKHIVQKSIK